MKRKRQTLFQVALATLLLMLLSLFPHHHHSGGTICWAMEVCQEDGNINDAHTHHPHSSETHLCFYSAKTKAWAVANKSEAHEFSTPFYPFFAGDVSAFHNALCANRFLRSYIPTTTFLPSLCWRDVVVRRGPPCA